MCDLERKCEPSTHQDHDADMRLLMIAFCFWLRGGPLDSQRGPLLFLGKNILIPIFEEKKFDAMICEKTICVPTQSQNFRVSRKQKIRFRDIRKKNILTLVFFGKKFPDRTKKECPLII